MNAEVLLLLGRLFPDLISVAADLDVFPPAPSRLAREVRPVKELL